MPRCMLAVCKARYRGTMVSKICSDFLNFRVPLPCAVEPCVHLTQTYFHVRVRSLAVERHAVSFVDPLLRELGTSRQFRGRSVHCSSKTASIEWDLEATSMAQLSA